MKFYRSFFLFLFFGKYAQYLPIGHCYQVKSDNINEQLKEVLNFFNVNVKENNIYSRCQLCNSAEFLSVSKTEMNEMIYGNRFTMKDKSNANNNNYCNQTTNDWKNRTWQLSMLLKLYTYMDTNYIFNFFFY